MKRKKSISKRKAKIGLMFILPWLIGFLIFVFWPLIERYVFCATIIGLSRIVITKSAYNRRLFINYCTFTKYENQV